MFRKMAVEKAMEKAIESIKQAIKDYEETKTKEASEPNNVCVSKVGKSSQTLKCFFYFFCSRKPWPI